MHFGFACTIKTTIFDRSWLEISSLQYTERHSSFNNPNDLEFGAQVRDDRFNTNSTKIRPTQDIERTGKPGVCARVCSRVTWPVPSKATCYLRYAQNISKSHSTHLHLCPYKIWFIRHWNLVTVCWRNTGKVSECQYLFFCDEAHFQLTPY